MNYNNNIAELLEIKCKYDESLAAAKKLIKNDPDHVLYEDDIKGLFSELTESEDEKVRKHLIRHFSNKSKENWNGMPIKKILDWLDKVADKPMSTSKWSKEKEKMLDAIISIVEDWESKQEEGKLLYYSSFLKSIKDGTVHPPRMVPTNEHIVEYNLTEVKDIQSESGSIITPDFMVGDWLKHKTLVGDTFRITSINYEHSYYITNLGSFMQFKEQDNYRLWSVYDDARDGDILCAYECDEPKIVFINWKKPKRPYLLSYHCFYNIMYPHFSTNEETGGIGAQDVRPATEEQKSLLFQKIQEAGYYWNAADLRLVKSITANTNISARPKFKVGDWLYHPESGNAFHVAGIQNTLYISDEGATISFGREDDWRLWNIKDAKHRDVLYENNANSILMLKSTCCDWVKVYCDYWCKNGELTVGRGENYGRLSEMELTPATEEQRAFLLSKLNEKGWEFDPETNQYNKRKTDK